VEEVQFLEKDASGKIKGGWAEQQLATSADFCHDSLFWTHVSGGLNYQVVHHLFPGIIHTHYPAIAPIIKKHAAKAGLKYHVFPTFLSALGNHFAHLRTMGSLVTPSLHTIG
jgi:acyl-lipid (8-3)-desaturase